MNGRMRGAVVRWAALGALLALVGARGAEAGPVYLALGDSITFGVGQDDTAGDVSYGDRGYVAKYADYLKAQTGTRPTVINLAVSGETSASFFGNGAVGIDGPDASQRNLNYTGSPLPSQNALMLATIKKLGDTITDVTLSLGANDLFAAVAANPNLKPADLQAILGQYATNMGTILTEIRTLLPSTRLTLLNYYDPYAPFLGDTDPAHAGLAFLAGVSHQAIPALNGVIAQLAGIPAFHAGVADTFTPFVGREIADTYVTSGNVHPHDVGYGYIANAVEAAAVPEPSSVILVALGLAAVPLARLRRRA